MVLRLIPISGHVKGPSFDGLTSHEIVLIRGEAVDIVTDEHLSDYVVSTESAFSREHTQWPLEGTSSAALGRETPTPSHNFMRVNVIISQ